MTPLLQKPSAKKKQRIANGFRLLAPAPQLSVVIVNYHQWENTGILVHQLRSSQTMRRRFGEVLIIDNHSPSHPLLRKLRRRPGVSLLRWGRNRGFARAVNEGCRLSQGEWLLLLNPDMTLPHGFLDQVLKLMERLADSEPSVGIVGFGLKNADGSAQHSAGKFPTFFTTLARLLVPRARRKYQIRAGGERRLVDWVTGCCMLIRRDCWRELGGLDEDFFLYYEDVDLCRRARQAGWSVVYEPAIDAVHHNPLHRRSVPASLRVVTRHSLLAYGCKHWPRWQVRLLSRVIQLESWLRRCCCRLRNKPQSARLFAELGRLAGDLRHDRWTEVKKRLRRLAQSEHFYTNR